MILLFDGAGAPGTSALVGSPSRKHALYAPSFVADVYGGQPMFPRVSGSGTHGAPTVIDIAGARVYRFGRKTPILYAHNRLDPIGHTTKVYLTRDKIWAAGFLSVPGPSRDCVAGAAQCGFEWAVSLGYHASEMEYLPPGRLATVNKRQIRGPVNIARRGTLFEISFLAIGADPTASAKVGGAVARR